MLTIRKLAIASVSLLALATPAMAQDAAAEGTGEEFVESNEIVVQARRRDESVQDVPAVVNAVTAASIDKLNLRRLEDVASVVPGLELQANSNGIGSTTSLRGVQFDVIASGDSGTVQYYYNEAPVSSGVVLGGLYDIEMVEVLRGPQGTLKGRAAPSGAISMTFRRPDLDEVGGYAMGTVNDINGYNVNGAINLPIISDKLGLRIAGLVSDDDGNRVHPITGGQDLENRTEAARISLRADPFDGVFVVDGSYSTLSTNSLQYIQSESMSRFDDGFAASPVEITAKDRKAANRLPIENNSRIENFNVNAQLHGFGQRLTYVGNWARQNFGGFDPSRDGDRAGLFDNPYGLQYQANRDRTISVVQPARVVPFSQPNDSSADTDTHEIRLQNEDRIAGMFDYVAGFMSYKIESLTSFKQAAGGVAAPDGSLVGVILTPLQRFNSSEENSVFGNLTAHITDRAELSGGVRHIWYKTDAGVRACSNDFAICQNIDALGTKPEDRKDQATIFSVSGKYEFTNDLMGYVSYGTSWRPNTVVIGGPTVPSPVQKQFLGSPAEKSKSIEGGVKSTWLDGRLHLNLTAYYQKFDNYPYRSPGSGVYSIDIANTTAPVKAFNYITAVPVEVKGLEAEASFAITRHWNLSANVSYADGKIKNSDIPCVDLNSDGIPDVVTSAPTLAQLQLATGANGVSVCNVSQRANAASPWNATLTTEYTHPLADNVDGFLRGLFTWKGNAIGDPQNVYDSVDGYGLLNLFAGVRAPDGAWEITAYGKNLTNAFRVLSRSNGAEGTVLNGVTNSSTNYFAITSTQPREFGVTARFAFGSR
jgi:iron complex outermembrane receptor protein